MKVWETDNSMFTLSDPMLGLAHLQRTKTNAPRKQKRRKTWLLFLPRFFFRCFYAGHWSNMRYQHAQTSAQKHTDRRNIWPSRQDPYLERLTKIRDYAEGAMNKGRTFLFWLFTTWWKASGPNSTRAEATATRCLHQPRLSGTTYERPVRCSQAELAAICFEYPASHLSGEKYTKHVKAPARRPRWWT